MKELDEAEVHLNNAKKIIEEINKLGLTHKEQK